MDNRTSRRKKAIRRRRIFLSICAVCLVAVIAVLAISISAISKALKTDKNKTEPSSPSSSQSEPKEPYIVSSVTVVNTGDVLVHSPVLSGAKTADGGYDFSSFFGETSPYFKSADLSVINLEVTFGGKESGEFSGYPMFNSPDSLADTIKDAGLNLILTANNHSYDTGLFGMKRTVQVLKEKGLAFIGTKESESDPTYLVKNVNGIKLGVVCYTYETSCSIDGRKALNGGIISAEANPLINSFSYDRINDFYSEAQSVISAMKKDGADAIIFYMHWGDEYKLSPNTWQKSISQQLCNFGVNVIVGGHPHVLQPMEVIYSEDSQNTAVCIYSMGNAVSNQRQEEMDSCPSGHTEDGVLFYYTFDKYSDGKTVLSSVDLVPTWVNKYRDNGRNQYQIIPLENATDGADKYGLTGVTAQRAEKSYNRTKVLMEESLSKCQEHLGSEIRFGKPTK
ncbi:MAG: CapA family protein [Ruminococcaceae bacterium]|nr:CapA family protein [Oscillospiraceae bacterium]